MDKDFTQYVYARTERALTENEEYKTLQHKCAEMEHEFKIENTEYEDLTCKLDAKAQELCYLKGYKDALNLLKQ